MKTIRRARAANDETHVFGLNDRSSFYVYCCSLATENIQVTSERSPTSHANMQAHTATTQPANKEIAVAQLKQHDENKNNQETVSKKEAEIASEQASSGNKHLLTSSVSARQKVAIR